MSTGLGEIVLYRAADGGPALDVRLERESVWSDAHQMAELFGRDRTVIVRHIRNVYDSGELPRESTCAKNAQVAADGKVCQMDFYNLDMIISVGSRVNSLRGTSSASGPPTCCASNRIKPELWGYCPRPDRSNCFQNGNGSSGGQP